MKNQTTSSSFIKLRDTRRVAANAGISKVIVGGLRWLLPLSVVGILVALVVWPMIGAKELKKLAEKAVPNLSIDNLKLTGIDTKNEPYKLVAKHALQSTDSREIINLDEPQGEVKMQSGSVMASQALQGLYNQTSKKLWLDGKVQLFQDNGTTLRTEKAEVDLKQNSATGNQPVVIEGNFGIIHGQGFEMSQGGKHFTVTGRSKALLNLHSSTASGTKKE